MIKYTQNKNIDFVEFQKLLTLSEKTNQYTNRGPCKYSLEKKLHSLLGLTKDKTVICTSSGTSALHALYFFYQRRGLKRWGSASYTFPSCAVANSNLNLYDVDLDIYGLHLDKGRLKENDGFVLTSLFGTYQKNLNDFLKSAKENNKIVILDNASSPMSEINGLNICNFGDSCIGSLHHTKYLGFGEGGFIVIDKNHYEEINEILGFGFKSSNKRRSYSSLSSNFKISDVNSAAILQHIKRYDIDNHLKIQNEFVEYISKFENIQVFNYKGGVVYGCLPLLYKDGPIDNLFFTNLGVEAQKYYKPLASHPNSEWLFSRMINLPLHSNLSEYEIEIIKSIIKESSVH